VLSLLQLLKYIFKPILSLSIGAVILALGVVVAALTVAYLVLLPIASYVGPSPAILSWVSLTAAVAVVGIPAFSLMLRLTRWFSSYKLPRKAKAGLRIAWAVSIVICGLAAVDMASDQRHRGEVSQTESYAIEDDVVHVDLLRDKYANTTGVMRFFDLSFGKSGIINDNIHIELTKSIDDLVRVTTISKARGSNVAAATDRALAIKADHSVSDNQLLLPNYFDVAKSDKFRNQQVRYIISIPQGKTIDFVDDLYVRHSDVFEENCHCDRSAYSWTMGENGLYSEEWIAKYRARKTIPLGKISTLNMEGPFAVEIRQGRVNEAVLTGRKSDVDAIEYVQTKGTGTFLAEGHRYQNLKLAITVADVTSINAAKVRGMLITDLAQDELELTYHSDYDLKMYGDVKQLECELSGDGQATFIGSGSDLSINLKYAKVDAQKYKAANVVVMGDSRGRSQVYADASLAHSAALTHELEVSGQPQVEVLDNNND